MIAEEFLAVFPQSKLTPQSITDIYNDLTGVRQDVTKFRLVDFGLTRLRGTTLSAGTNQVIVVINAVGLGQLNFDGSAAVIDRPRGELSDFVTVEVSEVLAADFVTVQYALFTWN